MPAVTESATPVASATPETGASWGIVTERPLAAASLVASAGLLVQASAYALGWSDRESGGLVLWYVGYAMIIAPFAALLLGATRPDRQRLGASLNLTLLMYASWLLSNPVMSTRFDESLHVTTLVDLVDKDGFFHTNAMLPVSPHYPGLELATAGVHWLTGLPLFACQVFVVLVARVTFVLALYFLTSRIAHSTHVGQIAVVLYAASAQFYFFNAQFSYQTVAIAMLMAALYLLVRAFDSEREQPWQLLLGVQVCLAALAITHHLTSWLVLGSIWILVVLFRLGGERRRYRLTLVTAEIATIVVAGWTALITPLLLNYLSPIFSTASQEITSILSDGGERTLGSDAAGVPTPHWELLTIAGSVLLWVALLTPSCWAAWRRSSIGATPARYLPLALAASYPPLQLTRFSSAAAEIGDRASTFVTMAMALVVGVWLAPRLKRIGVLVVPGVLLLILGGTILGGGPDWQRMTGPYLTGAEQRSVDGETIAVADWAGRYLPSGSRIAADSTLSRVIPNFAPVQPINGEVSNVTPLFVSTSIDRSQIQLIQDFDIDFVLVDTRMVGHRPRTGALYPGSAGFADAQSVTPLQVDKFQGVPGFDLVLDGPVRVYDVRSLRGATSTFADRADPGLPGSWSPWQALVTLLVLVGAAAARRTLLDPRRFTDRDVWRPAVLLPIAMAIGAVGVEAHFAAWAGSLLLVALAGGLWWRTRSVPAAEALGRPEREVWVWTGVTGLVLALAFAIAFTSAWHALTDHAPLAPPADTTSIASTGSGMP